jgi:very-short-patch-repair endonuclease
MPRSLARFLHPLTKLLVSILVLLAEQSRFERDVYVALTTRGYRVVPQVKTGAYRLDMVVEGAGDVRLAIECDGDEYHGPDRWAHDMNRQRILERAGWVFWRCFASTWTLRKDEVLSQTGKPPALPGRQSMFDISGSRPRFCVLGFIFTKESKASVR